MYKIYKLFFRCIAWCYIYLFMPFYDAIVNGVLYVVARFNVNKRYVEAFTSIVQADMSVQWKFKSVAALYEYKNDPLNGALNYNWRSDWVAALCDYHGDCDKYSYLMSRVLPGGQKYTILPYSPNNWSRMHVVYVYEGNVFSSGVWHQYGLDDYLKWHYDGIDSLVMKFW